MLTICYVGYLIIFSENKSSIDSVKEPLNRKFHIKDLGRLPQFLGIELEWTEPMQTASMSSRLIEKIAPRQQHDECKTGGESD